MRLFIAVLSLLGVIWIGGAIATYVFSGLLMFAGIVALVESISILKWIFKRTSHLIDIMIFGFSVFALAHTGVTVSIGLSVAGLLFTLVYKPLFLTKKIEIKKVR